jgi:hypothetical protein
MKNNALLFIRSVLFLSALLAALFAAQLALDVALSGYRLSAITAFNIVEFRHLNNLYNRSINQLTGIVFTCVAIAVPLTANMYSLKFLEFFVQDRVNGFALVFIVAVNLANTWMGLAAKDQVVPPIQAVLVTALILLCYALPVPYLYYVFRFLHPNTLLERLEAEIIGQLENVRRRPARAASQRARVAAGIEHIANITIRSVDRVDRNTAIEGIFSLERALRAYWAMKDSLAPEWFVADQDFFLGYSSGAVADMTASRSWVEMKVLGQFLQVMSAAIPRIPELTSTIAKSLRKLGLETAARRDPALRELVAEYFNTFVRLALTRRDARSVFTVFNEYRLFAEDINGEHPALGDEVAYYFQYYAQIARDNGLTFIVESVAHDLGDLVRAAWRADAPNRQKLLERFLEYDAHVRQPLPGVKKAQAILASYFLVSGQAEAASAIRAHFAHLEPAFVQRLRDELLRITREKYWEINERRMNIDYVPDAQRAKLQEFFESLS